MLQWSVRSDMLNKGLPMKGLSVGREHARVFRERKACGPGLVKRSHVLWSAAPTASSAWNRFHTGCLRDTCLGPRAHRLWIGLEAFLEQVGGQDDGILTSIGHGH